ncbi:hypothetical protein [Sphingomonas sp.]|nr:hypothetical protein [Sphingomonas sp.]
MPVSILAADSAELLSTVTDTGTSCNRSVRFCAVTTTSPLAG